jgi:hypothetical protein
MDSIIKKIKSMHPVNFPEAVEVGKPKDMTDEQCFSVWAKMGFGKLYQIIQSNGMIVLPPAIYAGIDAENFKYFMTAWKPNKEDIDAINRGEPIYIKTISTGLPPMAVFTLDENGEGNF